MEKVISIWSYLTPHPTPLMKLWEGNFSVVSVILFGGGFHVTITHDALDLAIRTPSPSQTWDLNVQGSFLQVWDLTVQEPFVVFILIATVTRTILMFNISMHSSRMRTARLLTVSQHALCRGDVYPSMYWGEGVCPTQGVWQTTPPVNRMTDRCKNITLPQLRCGR